jgi:hypothetical protein
MIFSMDLTPSEYLIILGRNHTLKPSHDAPRPVRLP